MQAVLCKGSLNPDYFSSFSGGEYAQYIVCDGELKIKSVPTMNQFKQLEEYVYSIPSDGASADNPTQPDLVVAMEYASFGFGFVLACFIAGKSVTAVLDMFKISK